MPRSFLWGSLLSGSISPGLHQGFTELRQDRGMDTAQPPIIHPPAPRRRHTVTWKLLFMAALVIFFQLPLKLVNDLREDRMRNHAVATVRPGISSTDWIVSPAEGYRMVDRSLKYSALILTLVFAAFFLFETVAGLRLHAVHYGLVGAALCLFYLALLALGEVLPPGSAYVGAAVTSSLLIVLYCISILRSYARAGTIAALLASEHGVLYVVLRMENYALLAGTASLFVALAVVMFFTRKVDWFVQDAGREVRA
jgi:inner membrane protein